jgi:hypothetical protein
MEAFNNDGFSIEHSKIEDGIMLTLRNSHTELRLSVEHDDKELFEEMKTKKRGYCNTFGVTCGKATINYMYLTRGLVISVDASNHQHHASTTMTIPPMHSEFVLNYLIRELTYRS